MFNLFRSSIHCLSLSSLYWLLCSALLCCCSLCSSLSLQSWGRAEAEEEAEEAAEGGGTLEEQSEGATVTDTTHQITASHSLTLPAKLLFNSSSFTRWSCRSLCSLFSVLFVCSTYMHRINCIWFQLSPVTWSWIIDEHYKDTAINNQQSAIETNCSSESIRRRQKVQQLHL